MRLVIGPGTLPSPTSMPLKLLTGTMQKLVEEVKGYHMDRDDRLIAMDNKVCQLEMENLKAHAKLEQQTAASEAKAEGARKDVEKVVEKYEQGVCFLQ